MEDCWQWTEDIKGKYTVKSAYKILMDSYNVNTSGLDPTCWKKNMGTGITCKGKEFFVASLHRLFTNHGSIKEQTSCSC